MKYARPAVALIILLMLAASFTPSHHTSAQSTDETQLAELAHEAIEAQNEILVTGDIEGSLKKNPKAASTNKIMSLSM
jgi:Tfp pilus assembly protein PilF